MHILTFKMPAIRQVQLLFSTRRLFFVLISMMLIYIFLLLGISVLFTVYLAMQTLSMVLPFGLAVVPRVVPSFTKPILFLCCCQGLQVIIYFDDILVHTYSKHPGKRSQTFLCSLLVCLGLHIHFSKSELHLTQ